MYDRTIRSVIEFGFVDPVTVREVEDRYEIIDGEHRWRAVRDLIEDPGGTVPADMREAFDRNEALREFLERKQIPFINLGAVSDAAAQQLNIILNNTRGEPDAIKLSELVARLEKSVGRDELLRVLPYQPEQLDALLELLDFDWSQYSAGEAVTEPTKWIDFKAKVPEDAWPVVESEFDRIGGILELKKGLSEEVRRGLILEKICVLSAETPTESLG